MKAGKKWIIACLLLVCLCCSSCGAQSPRSAVPKSPRITSYIYLAGSHSFDVYAMPGSRLLAHRSIDAAAAPHLFQAANGGVYLIANGAIALWRQQQRRWETPLDGGNAEMLVEQKHYIAVGTEQVLHVLDANTGKELWQKPVASGIFGSHLLLQIMDTTVVVGQGLSIRAYDIQSGNIRWQTAIPAEDGSVIENMHALGSRGGLFVTTATSMWMYQAASGHLLWNREEQALFLGSDTKNMYVAIQTLPVVSEDGGIKKGASSVAAIESLTGAVQWQDASSTASPADKGIVTNHNLVWASANGTVAWRLVDGRREWQQQDIHPTGLVTDGGSSVLICEHDTFASLDEGSGQTHWRKHVPGDQNCVVQLEVPSLYIIQGTGGLVAMDANAREQWRLSLPTDSSTWAVEMVGNK